MLIYQDIFNGSTCLNDKTGANIYSFALVYLQFFGTFTLNFF